MNTFLNGLIDENNYGLTENGAIKHSTTKSAVLDMFALCAAYRNRSDADCILAFKNALEEDEILALKCLFYLRDCRGGQGERRFFRVCFKWLANEYPEAARRNLVNIAEYGRWDDIIYSLVDTPLEKDAFAFIQQQLMLDVQCKTPSLLAKWLPSENASARITKRMAQKMREYIGCSHKAYRKMLSDLRGRIKVVEKLMSQNRWDEIEFDKLPSVAGIRYKNAFARRDILAKKYEEFAKDKTAKVNAKVLNPVDIAHRAFNTSPKDEVSVNMLQKYWDCLPNYYGDHHENGIAIVDTSGSMMGLPLEAAVSMGAYIAEKAHGPFANHFITFSHTPDLIKFEGINIVDKFRRCTRANWNMDTNIEAVFDMLLKAAKEKNTKLEDMPDKLYIFSDMEFNRCISDNKRGRRIFYDQTEERLDTLLETIEKRWADAGYQLPRIIFWNLNARSQNIPALGGKFSYVSGFSMNMVECILSGKDGYDLCLEKLLSERYALIK